VDHCALFAAAAVGAVGKGGRRDRACPPPPTPNTLTLYCFEQKGIDVVPPYPPPKENPRAGEPGMPACYNRLA
jgi:hypothetical protein